jgi:hypothetical protein
MNILRTANTQRYEPNSNRMNILRNNPGEGVGDKPKSVLYIL